MTSTPPAGERMNRPLDSVDLQIADLLREEARRQATGLELIPSENLVSEAVLEAMGSILTNKYAEGYPGRRYYGGCEFADKVEQLTIDRGFRDRKSTRLNSSHGYISYAVFCLKKKKKQLQTRRV